MSIMYTPCDESSIFIYSTNMNLILCRGHYRAILLQICVAPIKYVNLHQTWLMWKVFWVLLFLTFKSHFKPSNKQFIFVNNNKNRSRPSRACALSVLELKRNVFTWHPYSFFCQVKMLQTGSILTSCLE